MLLEIYGYILVSRFMEFIYLTEFGLMTTVIHVTFS
jgi:hypothetical protein